MNQTNLESTYKFIRLRLEIYTEDDFDKELFIFSVSSYNYIVERLIQDGIQVEFEQVGSWEYKLRKVEFNNG